MRGTALGLFVAAALLAWPGGAAATGCDGAAARAPGRACPQARGVDPAPDAVARERGAPCRRRRAYGLAQPCAFGVSARRARRTVALIGDSHAAHWRTALAAFAPRERWRVYALTRNSCPFAAGGRGLPRVPNLTCARWKADVLHWLRTHRRVSTVVLAEEVSDVSVPGAPDPFAAVVESYVKQWRALPRSIRHVVVIRDTPAARPDVLRCVAAAALPAQACALPEAVALPPDPAVAAAQQLGAPRFASVDLTSFFCDGTSCFPVVGGVLVYLDSNHLTPRFVATLAPYLDDRLRHLGR